MCVIGTHRPTHRPDDELEQDKIEQAKIASLESEITRQADNRLRRRIYTAERRLRMDQGLRVRYQPKLDAYKDRLGKLFFNKLVKIYGIKG